MNRARAAARFFTSRWRTEVPLGRVFWLDMMLTGTLLNVLASFVALALAAQRAPVQLVAAAHFAPLPYNVFLFAAVWRGAAQAPALRAAAAAWLLAATLL